MREITSSQNPQVKAWKKLVTRKGRKQQGLFLAEGEHLVTEALKSPAVQVQEVLFTAGTALPEIPEGVLLTQVSGDVMAAVTDTQTPQGISALCTLPDDTLLLPEGSRFLLLDAVQDPGNLGTLIRTADAVGVDAVILGEGCADPYAPKVMRSGQGSQFHLPLIHMTIEAAMAQLTERNIQVLGSALENARDFREVNAGGRFGLIMGNEGQGIRPEILAATAGNLYVPIYGQSESLNVAIAAGILLYHLRG